MPEYLRSLAVIVLLATLVFAFAKRPVLSHAISEDDVVRRRNLWFFITLAGFISQNFWILMVLVGLLLVYGARGEQNKVALFLFLVLTLPRVSVEIPGVAGIRYLLDIDYVRLLCLIVLLPAFLEIREQQTKADAERSTADIILAAYVFYGIALALVNISVTSALRSTANWFIDVVLPYYVISRSTNSMQRFRDSLMSFSAAGMVAATVGIFEFSRHWLLYAPLDDTLGIASQAGDYLLRGDSLRALASAGQPIAFGYVMAVAFGLFFTFRTSLQSSYIWLAGLTLFVCGAIASLSRGPWVGIAVMIFAYILTGGKALPRLAKLALLVIVALPFLLYTTAGEKLLDYLPFVGSVDSGNVTYRQQLLEISLNVILDNPWFGSPTFALEMEEMRQGQGIIDIVNTYLVIALNAGLVGLGLFLSFFVTVMLGIFRCMRTLKLDDDLYLLGQALFATLAGILVIIFTVSPITVVPLIYWVVAGLGMAYINMVKAQGAR